MTFDTVVLMKKSAAVERINSPVDMSKHADIKYGVVKDGFTENFFKRSDKQFYKDMYAKMHRAQLPLTSGDGVRKVRYYQRFFCGSIAQPLTHLEYKLGDPGSFSGRATTPLGSNLGHIASPVSQLQETGVQTGSFRRLSGYGD